MKRYGVVFTLVTEILLPFLFYSPYREHRTFSSLVNIFLMITIALTGNYNFFNFLSALLMLIVLDDRFMFKYLPKKVMQAMNIQMPLEYIVDEINRKNFKDRHWSYKLYSRVRTLTAYISLVSFTSLILLRPISCIIWQRKHSHIAWYQ